MAAVRRSSALPTTPASPAKVTRTRASTATVSPCTTLNCGKEKIEKCTANAPGAKTVKEDDLHGGYSNIGIGSSEVSQCVSVVEFTFDDAIPSPCD